MKVCGKHAPTGYNYALLAMLPAGVVAAARERGRQRDFWATGQELLAELEAAGWGEESATQA